MLDRLRLSLRALRHRDLRLFFAGQGVSLVGTWMQQVAVSWLVYRLTGSALVLGVVAFGSQFPALLMAPIAGALADRWNRYRMVVAAQVLYMAQATALAVLVLTGAVQVWHLVALSVWQGLVSGVDIPAPSTPSARRLRDLLGRAAADRRHGGHPRRPGPTAVSTTASSRSARRSIWGSRMRTTGWRLLVALCVGMLALGLAACDGDQEGGGGEPPQPVSLTLGLIPIVDVAPVFLGIEQGFFEEENLEIETQFAAGGAAIVPAVISGDFEIGFSNNVSLIVASTQGLPIEIISPGVQAAGTAEP
ncbi:MAG: MFS transporter, partial [Gemmatimonadetes bacterium]|nr:MFS transporter [Gemmatimonadota bacterium]